jgi:hypothetical protein
MAKSLLLLFGLGLTLTGGVVLAMPVLAIIGLAAFTVTLVGMAEPVGHEKKKIKAGTQLDSEGKPKVFTLSLGSEQITLEPGKTWGKADEFKWVTRGLIEPPQSFHITTNATVEINSEKISLDDPQGPAKLEYEINKNHVAAAPKSTAASTAVRPGAASSEAPATGKVAFKVHLDLQGHLMIDCRRGSDRAETGLRGVPTLIRNGFMLQPKSMHVDPLQKSIEIDGSSFDCTEVGARKLQEVLNAHYAATAQKTDADNYVDVKENPASSTGFDIRFITVHAGARFEIKGHLAQDKLDILQDPFKCDLLRPGTVLRLSPPNLLIRRRRPDGGEEKIPELPDIQYRHLSEIQFQQILNHPAIRKSIGSAAPTPLSVAQEQLPAIREIRVVRNPLNPALLWMEFETSAGEKIEGRALSHHNLADLQFHALFLSHLEVTLSVDNRRLSILDKPTQHEESISLDAQSCDEALKKAGAMLTSALKPSSGRHLEVASPESRAAAVSPGDGDHALWPKVSEPVSVPLATPSLPPAESAVSSIGIEPALDEVTQPAPAVPAEVTISFESLNRPNNGTPTTTAKADREPSPDTAKTTPASAPSEPALDQAVVALFGETDPLRINTEIFRCLALRLGAPAQDVRLSLSRVFDNRRFEIINFSHEEITSVLELRGGEFTGFYLSHINDQNVLLVYARNGKHLEWGAKRCLLEPGVGAEASEFKGSALLGMALDQANQFVFVVTPQYKVWVKAHEKLYLDVFAHFIAVNDLAADAGQYSLIWPEPPGDLIATAPATLPWAANPV